MTAVPPAGPGTPAAPVADGLPPPQRGFAFAAVGTAIMMAVLNGATVNVALPTIAAGMGVTPAAAISVVTAYQLAVVVSLLPFAALGEALGFRRIYFAGVAVFAAASLLCALADSIAVLAAARVLQGLGAGVIMAVNGAMVRHIMPLDRIGRGLSGVALIVAVATAAGPSVAGLVLSLASWPWLFLINLPLCVIVLVAGWFSLPHVAGSGHRFDGLGALLNALAFGLLVSGLGSLGRDPVAPAATAAQFGVALVAFVLLARRQMRAPAPMLPVDLLRIRPFSQAIVASVCSYVAQFLVFVSLPFYLHDVLGRSAFEIGVLLTPWPVATAVVAPLAGRLADRWSAELLSMLGMTVFALGLLSLAFLPAAPEGGDLVWRLILCGLGFGLFQSPNTKVVMTSAPRRRSGGASGMQATARVLGQSVGAALAAILIGRAGGFDLQAVMLAGTALAAVAIVVTLMRHRETRHPPD